MLTMRNLCEAANLQGKDIMEPFVAVDTVKFFLPMNLN